MESKKQKYCGKSFVTKAGEVVKLLDIKDNLMFVEFEGSEGTVLTFKYRTPKDGMTLKNYFAKDVYDVGYLGERYSTEDVDTVAHRRWRGMMGRCYSDSWKGRDKATVCEEWHCFANFHDWFSQFKNKTKQWHIDKDLEGAMIYSPQTVHYIPESLNIQISATKTALKKYHLSKSVPHSKMVLTGFISLRSEFEDCCDQLENRTVIKLEELLNELKNVSLEILK